MKWATGEQYALRAVAFPPSLPPLTLAAWPTTCVFVTDNEARKYIAASYFAQR